MKKSVKVYVKFSDDKEPKEVQKLRMAQLVMAFAEVKCAKRERG